MFAQRSAAKPSHPPDGPVTDTSPHRVAKIAIVCGITKKIESIVFARHNLPTFL